MRYAQQRTPGNRRTQVMFTLKCEQAQSQRGWSKPLTLVLMKFEVESLEFSL